MNVYIHTYSSPVGDMLLGDHDGKLVLADWKYRKQRERVDKRIKTSLKAEFIEQKTSLHDAVIKQLDEYFSGQRTEFTIPLQLIGTDFQKQVWYQLTQIPFGTTRSYLTLSQRMKNEKAIRAVAAANGANPISIMIPCHRVIGNDGKLVGYAGGLSSKEKLLQLEQVMV